MPGQRKMVNLSVRETSGVDHPAHLLEGWVVAKSAKDSSAATMFERFLKSSSKGADTMPEPITPEALEAAVTEAVTKAVAEATAPLTATIETLTTERDEAVAKAKPADAADTRDDFEKSLDGMPAAAVAMLKAQRDEITKARDEVRKERETRLDAAAVATSRETYKSLAIDHDTVAPALRRLGEDAPEVAKAIADALAKADGQAESGRIFGEIGAGSKGSGAGSTAMTKAREVAKALVAAGTVATIEQGVTKAFEDTPDLYAQYRAEKDA